MKNKTKYLILLIGLLVARCEGDYKVESPNFDVAPQKIVCKVGEALRFDMSGSADLVMFYSGEFGNDYAYHNTDRITPARMSLSFDTKATTSGNSRRFNPAYAPVSYSADFNGQYDLENMNTATWTDISPAFKFPPTDGMVDAINGALTVPSGAVDLTDYFPSKQAPIYLRFNYKVSQYDAAAQTGRTTILISNFFINGITAAGSAPIHSITEIPWAFVQEASWEGATGTTRLPGTQANLQFQCEWSPKQEREIWAIAGPIYMSADVNSGLEPAVCIKVVADPDLRSYSHVYKKAGIYKPTFVAANSNVNGRKEITKQFIVEVVEDSGAITPPTDEVWPN